MAKTKLTAYESASLNLLAVIANGIAIQVSTPRPLQLQTEQHNQMILEFQKAVHEATRMIANVTQKSPADAENV